MPNCI